MIILGLDPGLARTGFGLIATDTPNQYIQSGCLTTPQEASTPDRILELGNDLEKLVIKAKPDIAAIESVFFHSNAKTAMLTAQARGALLYVLRRHNIRTTTLTPLQIKSQLTGFGRADKQQIQAAVTARLKLDRIPKPDDAADALAAALCLSDTRLAHPHENGIK